VIFTDLDGTLLDENYSFEDAREVVEELKKRKIPLIFCSAKTKVEQEYFLKLMKIAHPFIVEDGSAIFVPRGYFKRVFGKVKGEYEVRILGVKRGEIIEEIQKIEERGLKIKGFFNMSDVEVARLTGLNKEMAKKAMERGFSEIVVEADEEAIEMLKKRFNVTLGGRFLHIYGKGADKGKAVKILVEFFKEEHKGVKTIGIGNSYTDEPMLKNVDLPILVRNQNGWAEIKVEGLKLVDEIGPRGFAKAINDFILKSEKLKKEKREN